MTEAECLTIIDEFDRLIADTRALMVRLEAEGMDKTLEADYLQVHALYAKAVAGQRAYTLSMLEAS